MSPGEAEERHADQVADAVVRGEDATELLGAPAFGRSSAVQYKKREGALPESIAPPADEGYVDGEGNAIECHNGHWHLVDEPIAPGSWYRGGKPQALPINPNAAYAALRAAANEVMNQQQAVAESLKGDMKYWFARVYFWVTWFELIEIENGTYLYPHMKLQEVIHFNATYQANLAAWESENAAAVETHWKHAFELAEAEAGGTFWQPKAEEIFDALLPSMQAHIRFDLPRSIATCFQLHYAGIPGLSKDDFKADFDRMLPVFDKAGAEAMKEIVTFGAPPPGWLPKTVADAIKTVGDGARWALQGSFPAYFDITGERERTWNKAELLSDEMEAGGTPEEVSERFTKVGRAETGAAHPHSGADDFAIGGVGSMHGSTDVGDSIDWTRQPGAKPDKAAPAATYLEAPEPPSFPQDVFFELGLPGEGGALEDGVRPDQDLTAFTALAEWTRQIRSAVIVIDGHASAEGRDNAALAHRRAKAMHAFLAAHGADLDNNTFASMGLSDLLARPNDPEWRFVRIRVVSRGTAKQMRNTPNKNLPSEVSE